MKKTLLFLLLAIVASYGFIVAIEVFRSEAVVEKRRVVESDLKELRNRLQAYQENHNGSLPSGRSWFDDISTSQSPSLHPCSDSADCFAYKLPSPSTIDRAIIVEYRGSSQNAQVEDPLMIPEKRHGGYVCVLFDSGRIQWKLVSEARDLFER